MKPFGYVVMTAVMPKGVEHGLLLGGDVFAGGCDDSSDAERR